MTTLPPASEITEDESFIDSGSYILMGSYQAVYLVVYLATRSCIAGESSTGKTFFSLAVVQNFLSSNPDGICLYSDTESAITRSLLESRGIDTSRVVVINVVTIEEFRSKALLAVDKYLKVDPEKRQPMMFVLDSLGMLSTEKEISDALADKQVRDMTKSQLVKGASRMLTLKLGQAQILLSSPTTPTISVLTSLLRNGRRLRPQVCSVYNHSSQQEEREGWNRSGRQSYQS